MPKRKALVQRRILQLQGRGGGGGGGGDGDKRKICGGTCKDGEPCTKPVRYELCYFHAVIKMKVRVFKSPVFNGILGLFAFNGNYDDRETIIFKKNDVIGEYKGELLSRKQLGERYPNKEIWPKYVYQCHQGLYIDAVNDMCLMAMMNSASGRPKLRNAKFCYDRTRMKCHVKATKNIKNVGEICPGYRFQK